MVTLCNLCPNLLFLALGATFPDGQMFTHSFCPPGKVNYHFLYSALGQVKTPHCCHLRCYTFHCKPCIAPSPTHCSSRALYWPSLLYQPVDFKGPVVQSSEMLCEDDGHGRWDRMQGSSGDPSWSLNLALPRS